MATSVFKQIQHIAQLLRRYRKGVDEILGGPGETLQHRFLESIDLEEAEVAKKLGVKLTDQSYLVLKSAVYRKILNAIFLIEVRKDKDHTSHSVARDENDRSLFAAKTLAFLGVKDGAEFIAKREIGSCEKYEFYANGIEFLSILTNAASVRGDIRAFKKHITLQTKWLSYYSAEVEMGALQNELLMRFATRGPDQPQVREKLRLVSFKAGTVFKANPTFKLGLISYRLQGFNYEASWDYEQAIRLYRDAEEYIQSKPQFATPIRLSEFALKRLGCAIQLRNKKEGVSAAKVCLGAYTPGSFNWHATMEQLFLLYMSTLDFENAEKILQQVTSSGNGKTLDDLARQRWQLHMLYLQYAQSKLKLSYKLENRRTFKDFLRLVPAYSSDKVGYNMSALILHILYLIETGDRNAINNRLEALEKYRTRHLKDKGRQADLFIQLLIAMVKAKHIQSEVRRETEGLFNELKAIGARGAKLEGVQILPFEWLWERILSSLPSRL
jgi:tetratricopeptide (TPR) repeat protein